MGTLRSKRIGVRPTGILRSSKTERYPIISVEAMKKDRGSVDYRWEDELGLVISQWQDNNVLTVASTAHSVTPMFK